MKSKCHNISRPMVILGLLVTMFFLLGAQNDQGTATEEMNVIDKTLPDLQVTIENSPKQWSNRKQATVTVKITNLGGTTARNFSVGLYLSRNSTITQRDLLLLGGRKFIQVVRPKKTILIELTGSHRNPETVSAGSYYLGVIVDETNQVKEQYENNNTASAFFYNHRMRQEFP